jgi:hypothetical protein
MQRIAVTLWRRADQQQEQVIARRSEINPENVTCLSGSFEKWLEERSAVQIRKDLVKDITFLTMIGSQVTLGVAGPKNNYS